MQLKLFRASGMAEAMALVRAELGGDALILGTRRVAGGIEVTAALEPAGAVLPEPLEQLMYRTPLPRHGPDTPGHDDKGKGQLAGRAAMLEFHGVPPTIAASLEGGALETALARTLAFTQLPLSRGDRPLLLTGPPGAGKTLTAARLATRLVMAGSRPLVITSDGQRAGAAEQLAAFTRLLDLGLVSASNPVTLGRAMARRENAQPVLIDTAGCDPFDPDQNEGLRALAAAADAVVALVLPAGLDPAEAADIALAHQEAGACLLIVTRVDLARRLGGLISAAASAGLPLTEIGIGPGAADGLVPLTPAVLASLLTRTGNKPAWT